MARTTMESGSTSQKPTPKNQGSNAYSDASSSYWPPGWDFTRFKNITASDLATLPESELLKMQAGLRDVLGEDGVDELARFLRIEKEKEEKALAIQAGTWVPPEFMAPSWLMRWREHYQGGQRWGLVGFRTTDYDNEERWRQFKERVQRVVEIPFEYEVDKYGNENLPGDFKDAREGFEICWVEDPRLEGANAEVLRERYKDFEDYPGLFRHDAFLCASPEAVSSILDIDEENFPTIDSKRWRVDAPFLLAVAADADPGLEEGHEEREWFKPVFKVAVETLVDEFWFVLDTQMMDLRRLTRTVKGSDELGMIHVEEGESLEDIWWSLTPSPARMRRRRRM